MDEKPDNPPQVTPEDEQVVPPLVSAPLLTAFLLFIVLPVLTVIVVFLMWAFS